jgi:hypothetical protein
MGVHAGAKDGLHPGVVTDHDKHGNVGMAQASKNLPKSKFPHQLPSQEIVPSANLHENIEKSHINVGKPDYHPIGDIKHDRHNRKANFFDTMKLKFKQCMSFSFTVKADK